MYYKKYGELPKIADDQDLKAIAGMEAAAAAAAAAASSSGKNKNNKTLTSTSSPTDDVTLKLEPHHHHHHHHRSETATSMTSTKLNQSMTTSTDVDADDNNSRSTMADDYQEYDQSMNESGEHDSSVLKKPEAKMPKLSHSPNSTITSDVHIDDPSSGIIIFFIFFYSYLYPI